MSEHKRPAKLPSDDSRDGLTCPRCGCRHFLNANNLRALRTEYIEEGIKRTRYCRNCKFAIVTIERRI